MLLIIHNLPPHMRYADVKAFIVSKCGFKNLVLDDLVTDGRNTKVTVGLAREEDVMILVRKINGLFLEGRKLYVEDLRQEKHSEQALSEKHIYGSPNTHRSETQQFNCPTYMNYQQDQYLNYTPGDQLEKPIGLTSVTPVQVMPVMVGMNMEGFYMQQEQNSFMDYSGQSQQFSSSAIQYPQFSGQQGQSGPGPDYQTPKEDEWSYQRQVQYNASHEDTDNSHRYQSTYKPDGQQSVIQSGGWAKGRDVDTLTRRSRSPRNKRERSYGRSSLSPKRRRNDNYNRDLPRNSSNSNRYPERYTSDHDKTYRTNYQDKQCGIASQTYGNSNHNKPYYNNDRPFQNQGKEKTYNPAMKHQMFGRLSDLDTNEDEPHDASWDRKVTSPLDSRSNYRIQIQNKATQNLSKNDWRNPAQKNWDIRDTTSDRSGSRSQYSWRNQSLSENDTEQARWGDQNRASDKGKAQLGKNLQTLGKRWEGSSFDKPQLAKYAPKGKSNLETKWPKKNKSKGKMSVTELFQQDSNWRFKAAAQIASDMANENPDIIKTEYLMQLQKSVRARLDMLLEEQLVESIPKMVAIYRAKFPPWEDQTFCQLVVHQIQTEQKPMVDLTGSDKKIKGKKQVKPNLQVPKKQLTGKKYLPISQTSADMSQPKAGKSQPIAGKSQQKAGKSQPIAGKSQPIAEKKEPIEGTSELGYSPPSQPVLPRLQLPKSSEKLPTYPNANKQVYKEQKKLKKLEHQNEDLYKMSPLEEKALEEELTIITDVFNTVTGNPDSEAEKEYCKRFLRIGLEQVRKVVKLNVTKRILNINTNLIIRVLIEGKKPPKREVELFFRNYEVVSLKKSGKRSSLYIVNCTNFQSYDRLCHMKSARLGPDTLLRFKPFQLVGPKISYRERNEMRAQRIMGPKNTTDEYIETNQENLENDNESDHKELIEHDEEGQGGEDDKHVDNKDAIGNLDLEDLEEDLEDYY